MGLVVDAVIAAIALAALIVSWWVARRQTAIQERVAAIEEARRAEEVEARGRARVTASLERGGGRLQLVLRNEGQAVARSVKAELEQGPRTPAVLGLEDLPVDLQPGQPMPFPIPMALGDATMFRVTVRWADEAGDHEKPYKLSTL
jgi:hypothetical protein